MRELLVRIKWPLLVLVNTLPFLLDVVFYKNGSMDDLMLFVPIYACLTYFNYRCSSKTWQFVVLQLYIEVCLFFAGWISTILYYNYISDDFMTPVVGQLFVFMETGLNVIVSIVVAVWKKVNIEDSW